MLKLALEATCKRYDVARLAAFQFSVKLTGMFFDPSTGESSAGMAGAATMVVKFHAVEYGLTPPMFVAFTRQQYFRLFDNGPTTR